MECLLVTGAMKSTPTAAMDMLLNLTPLDLLIVTKVRVALYRLQIFKQPSVHRTVSVQPSGKMWMNVCLTCGQTTL
jgi:hypothetical protein